MKILTNENSSFHIHQAPEDLKNAPFFCVLDYSNQLEVDYYFFPLKHLESFYSPCIDVRIGNDVVQMPLDWSIVIGDINLGDLEVIPLLQVMDKDFDAFCFNPLKGYMPSFKSIEILNVWPDIKWHVPQLKTGHLLAVPLNDSDAPLCAFFVKEINKLPDSLDIRKVF